MENQIQNHQGIIHIECNAIQTLQRTWNLFPYGTGHFQTPGSMIPREVPILHGQLWDLHQTR